MQNKIKAIHTIEYLRNEIATLETYNSDNELLESFKTVLAFVEDCNEDYLSEITKN